MSFVSVEAVVIERGRSSKGQLWGVKVVRKEGDPAQLLQLSAARALAQKAEKKGDKPLSDALRREIAKAERQMRGSA
jgi:hypothetical protein